MKREDQKHTRVESTKAWGAKRIRDPSSPCRDQSEWGRRETKESSRPRE